MYLATTVSSIITGKKQNAKLCSQRIESFLEIEKYSAVHLPSEPVSSMSFSGFSCVSRVVASRLKLEIFWFSDSVTFSYYLFKLFSEYNESSIYFLKSLLIIPTVRFKVQEQNSRLSFLEGSINFQGESRTDIILRIARGSATQDKTKGAVIL